MELDFVVSLLSSFGVIEFVPDFAVAFHFLALVVVDFQQGGQQQFRFLVFSGLAQQVVGSYFHIQQDRVRYLIQVAVRQHFHIEVPDVQKQLDWVGDAHENQYQNVLLNLLNAPEPGDQVHKVNPQVGGCEKAVNLRNVLLVVGETGEGVVDKDGAHQQVQQVRIKVVSGTTLRELHLKED